MKKMKFFAMALAAMTMVAGFSSCSKDDESKGAATITIDQGSSVAVTDGKIVLTGSIVAPDGATIDAISVDLYYGDGNKTTIASSKSATGITKVSDASYTFRFDQTSVGIKDHLTDATKLTINVIVKDGDASSKSITITTGTTPEPVDTLLATGTAFTWVRTGNEETVLNPVGLKFGKSNVSKAVYAQIIKNTATKMVDLSAYYGQIAKKSGLKTAVDSSSDIDVIKKIQVDGATNKDYTLAIGTKVGNEYYLVNITNVKYETVTAGTKVTVTGNWQK